MYVSIFRSQPRARSLERYRATRSRLAPPDYFRAVDVYTHELGDDLGRHFLNREGALIHYSFACVHFLSDRTRAERNDAALE